MELWYSRNTNFIQIFMVVHQLENFLKNLKYEAIKGPQCKKIIKQLPLYWGSQPITSGPTMWKYCCFPFCTGFIYSQRRFKYWILFATVLSIASMEKNYVLTDLFLDYFPAYNKFRAVSMILVAEFTIPLLAIMALDTISNLKR